MGHNAIVHGCETQDYFDKLQLRTGYTYEGKFDATSAWVQ